MSRRGEWSQPDPLDGCPWGCGARAVHGASVACPPSRLGDGSWANSSGVALGTTQQLIGDVKALASTREANRCPDCRPRMTHRIRAIGLELERRQE